MRFSHLLAAAAAAFGISTASAKAADWTGFRGPNGQAVSDDRGLPTKWSTTEGLRWKADLPGRGLSNPVIANGKVIVTACSGFKQRRLHVLCFEEKSGAKLWERQFTATGGTLNENDSSTRLGSQDLAASVLYDARSPQTIVSR